MSNHKDHLAEQEDKTLFGFWIYLLTDCVLFASLFATYAVLRNSTNGGPGPAEIFELPFVLVETLILLTSSFTSGIALLYARSKQIRPTLILLAITGLLGAAFVGMELYEFNKLIGEGHGPTASAFLTAFFTLVGTHGLHITVGLTWLSILGYFIVKRGLTAGNVRRIALFSLFWHFLDIVWIFIFTLVYMFGAHSL
jgi:cytochrome o ubiquinol oxidase subunit III